MAARYSWAGLVTGATYADVHGPGPDEAAEAVHLLHALRAQEPGQEGREGQGGKKKPRNLILFPGPKPDI